MGEGRAAWDAAYEDAHTWGGPVTIAHGGGMRGRAKQASVIQAGPLGQPCQICGRALAVGDVIVPSEGSGRMTRWAHKICKVAR